MDKRDHSFSFGDRLLAHTGGWYPIIVLFIAQLATSSLGLLLAAIPSHVNAELSFAQVDDLLAVGGIALLTRNIILLALMYFISRQMFARLVKWSKSQSSEPDIDDSLAWKQATSFSWRYILVALASLFCLVLPPVLIYMHLAFAASPAQMIYVALASGAAGFGLAVLENLSIEYLMMPVRQALLPRQFEAQLNNVKSFPLLTKNLVIIIALIVIGLLLVAPVGYHQTMTALSGRLDPQRLVQSLQIQLIVASLGTLLLGLFLAYLMTRSTSAPIQAMIRTFGKVENGDLSQRVEVTATDEIGELMIYFNHMVARLENLQTSMEDRGAFRTKQLNATLEVGRVASATLDPEDLIAKIVNMITDRFGYYYTAIFLTDSTGRWAELKNATGAAGQALKERGHKLEIGGKSMVSTAITTRQGCIALDVGAAPMRFDNPLLPDTRSEIALPLTIGERVVGALDVQSTQEAAFDEEDINTLQGMANQLAIALENARLFQEMQKSLEDLRIAQRSYITEAWSETAREHEAYEYAAAPETAGTSAGQAALDVPLTLREQVIGELHLEGQQDWTPEERNLVEAVATQAALAMENARLLEESRQMALRERLAAEITGKIWSSPNADFILQTAIKELARALRADEASIELKME